MSTGIVPVFNPDTGASGGPSGGGGTQPTLSVSGRAAGAAYAVTPGARSLSITAQSGATLLTTVTRSSDGASVTVTGSTTTTPSWTSLDDEAYQVLVVATLGGLTSEVGFTEADVYGAATGWTEEFDLDATTVTNTGPHSGGTNNFTVDGETLPITTTQFASNNGTIEGVNGTGIVITGGNASTSTSTNALDFTSLTTTTWNTANLRARRWALHYTLTSYDCSTNAGDGFFIGVSQNKTHNSGDSRVLWSDGDGAGDETRYTRNNASSSAAIDVTPRTAPASRVITVILIQGEIVMIQDTTGTAIPTPSTGSAFVAGGDGFNPGDAAVAYETLFGILSAVQQGSYTVTRIKCESRET